MNTAGGIRAIGVIVAFLAGVHCACAIDGVLLLSPVSRELPAFLYQAARILATGDSPTEPSAWRANRADRAYGADSPKPGRLSSAAGRFERERVLFHLLDGPGTVPSADACSPNIFDRAPPLQ